jgi:hypothetical protein
MKNCTEILSISSFFDIILIDEMKIKIVKCLEHLYNNYINTEILLNLTKLLVYIFSINNKKKSEYVQIYYTMLNSLSNDEKTKIFNNIKKINLSYQNKLDDIIIEKIMSSINYNIIKNYNYKNGYEILNNIFNIYDILSKYNKISIDIKIQLFNLLLNHNLTINDTKQIILIINKYL